MSYSIGATPKQGSFGISATPNDGLLNNNNNGESVSGPATGSLSQQPSILETLTYQNFKVAHQRVSLDVQLQEHSIKGIADIIIIPLIKNLDYITFDCKDLIIKDVWIENRRCEHYIHDNPIRNYMNKFISIHSQGENDESDILYNDNSIEQSHFLRNKFADLNEFPQERNKCQLMIKIPSTIKIKLQDTSTLANYTPITPSIRSTPQTFQQDAVFTPLTIRIEYDIKRPTTGVNFDTLDEDKPYLWNAYTTNNELCSTASYWMPCVDSFEEKSTWEIEISVPKKVKNIGTSKIIGQQDQQQTKVVENNNNNNSKDNENHHNHQDDDEDEDEDEEDDEDDDDEVDKEGGPDHIISEYTKYLNREIKVCCSEFSTVKELAHPIDLAKKVFIFQIFNPVAPHHIGWAVGAFDVWTLPPLFGTDKSLKSNEEEIEDNDENNKDNDAMNHNDNDIDMLNDDNSNDLLDNTEGMDIIPINVYTLPSNDINENTVINSTIVCQRIIDFYSKEFGSYPFTSYSLVFLPSITNPTMDFASMTICNTRLLYDSTILDQMFSTTDYLSWSIASQWSGINITPLEMNDIWCCLGIAGYMVRQFSKHLYGNNEFKYRLKKSVEEIVSKDWEKPPIGLTFKGASWPISVSSHDLDFIKLKAPMVLYILDRRMTKTERSFGMSRVLPKIFLQAMSGDLPNNSLSSHHFQHVCERVNKNKLEPFFQQWIYGAGVPIFRVTQRFNKKRMVVEMGIRQCQQQESEAQDKAVGEDGFFSSAKNHIENPNRNVSAYFTGSMTIRIHESDGTPYEHIVEIKDVFTKIDIQYNTKYRKLRNRRPHRPNKSTSTLEHEDSHLNSMSSNISLPSVANQSNATNAKNDLDDGDIQRLGNVLTTPENCYQWNLTENSKTTEANEAQFQNEAFEWIRIDSDFEWICKTYINQPDYMFASQLQQDGDVEAQLESLRYYEEVIASSNHSSLIYSSILTRTAMDDRYFYGIRQEACRTLSKYIYNPMENFAGGARHLIKIYQALFCLEDSNIPKNNDFSNIQRYILQKKIPKYLSQIKNETNECPRFVKDFLLDLLSYNENSENAYNDSHFVANLIDSVVASTLTNRDDKVFTKKVLDQLQRLENLDKWIPSYQLLTTKHIFEQKLKMHMANVYDFHDIDDVLQYSINIEDVKEKYSKAKVLKFREGLEDISLLPFKILLVEGGIKNRFILRYFFETLCFSPDVYIREKLIGVFVEAIDTIAENKLMDTFDDDLYYLTERINPPKMNFENEDDITALIIGGETGHEIVDPRESKLSNNINGVMRLIRNKFKDYLPLKKIMWDVLHAPALTLYQRKSLFDIARVIYTLTDSFKVKLISPRMKKLVAKYEGDNKVVIRRDGILKVHLAAPKVKVIPKPTETLEKSKSSTTVVSTGTNKVKITLNKPRKVSNKPSVNRIGLLPIRFVKLSNKYKKVTISSAPFSDRVKIVKANTRSFTIKVKYPKPVPPATVTTEDPTDSTTLGPVVNVTSANGTT
ncbi:hypothetical protein C6P44_002682 [Monosporozyma unispora]|nr:hypothetical protein C6P44_002682 [Kazachstania unispora]